MRGDHQNCVSYHLYQGYTDLREGLERNVTAFVILAMFYSSAPSGREMQFLFEVFYLLKSATK